LIEKNACALGRRRGTKVGAALGEDGLVVTAGRESSGSAGVDGEQEDERVISSGAAYTYW
jgi:hypothetical protein